MADLETRLLGKNLFYICLHVFSDPQSTQPISSAHSIYFIKLDPCLLKMELEFEVWMMLYEGNGSQTYDICSTCFCSRMLLSARSVQTRDILSLLLALRLLFVLSLCWKIILQPLQLFAEINLFQSVLCANAHCRLTTNIFPRLAALSAWANTIFSRWMATYTLPNKNPSAWNFISPEPEVTCGAVALIIRVVFLSPYFAFVAFLCLPFITITPRIY